MSHTIKFKGFVGFGIKQLNSNEFNYFCKNNSTNIDLNKLEIKVKTNLTDDVSTRVILSGCYYIDKTTGFYSSYGMEILETTNTTHTQCESNHLTQFAGGWITVPNAINFDDVWAKASFLENITIYMTVLVITSLYFILFIWTFQMDKKDERKKEIKLLIENEKDDIYFYEIIFYTGSRFNAATQSNVRSYSLIL